MLEIKSVIPIVSNKKISLSWELDSDLDTIFIWILRSYGTQNYDLITSLPLVNSIGFADYSLPIENHLTPILYQIKASDAAAGLDPEYEGADYDWDKCGPIDCYTKLNSYDQIIYDEIVRKQELLFSTDYTGIPVYVYKKKIFGSLCSDCANQELKLSTRSNCSTCYGTGRTGGYHLPQILSSARITVASPKQIRKTNAGPRGYNITYIVETSNLPVLDIDDLIYRPDNNEFLSIKAVEFIRFKESLPIYQKAQCITVPLDDVCYTLPI